MTSFALTLGVLLGLQCGLALSAPASELGPGGVGVGSAEHQQQVERSLEYALKRSLSSSPLDELLLDAGRDRRSSSMGSSFIRYGRNGPSSGKVLEAVSQPHTRSDIIIRYGRDELKNRLARLRQERMQRLARLALVCANKSQEEQTSSSAEDRIIREMCRDAPLHPTVPDFV